MISTPAGKVLVGRDVVAFQLIPGGVDTVTSTFNAGGTVDYRSTWTEIEITPKNNWADVTSSSADEKERRRTTWEWTASIRGRIRGATLSLEAFLENDYMQIIFTEASTGFTYRLTGGIEQAAMKRSADEGQDTLELMSIGQLNGQPSIVRLS